MPPYSAPNRALVCPICGEKVSRWETHTEEIQTLGSYLTKKIPGPTVYEPCGCVEWPQPQPVEPAVTEEEVDEARAQLLKVYHDIGGMKT